MLHIPCPLNASVCVCTHNISTDWTGTNISPLKFLVRLLSWLKLNQHPEIQVDPQNAALVFPLWLQCLLCVRALYFFSSTILPKYSFWNCWNSSSVNKDSGSLAFLAGRSGRSLDCLPVLWFRIYVKHRASQDLTVTRRKMIKQYMNLWWIIIFLSDLSVTVL